MGDSFVQGTCDPECRGWVGRAASAARTSGFDVTAYNLGIRRDTSEDIRQRWEAECAARLLTGSRNHVLFAFGANDMVLEETGETRVCRHDSVANFIEILRKAGTHYRVLAVGPLPVGNPGHNDRVLSLCECYGQAAAELGIDYLPVAADLVDNALWLEGVSAHDGSHPGAAGYSLLAQRIMQWSSWWFAKP